MGDSFVKFLPIVAIIVLLYLILIRPQQRRQRRMTDMRRQLVPGQRVMTNAGLFATVRIVEEEFVVLEIAPGVRCRFAKASVVQVVEEPGAAGDGSAGGPGLDGVADPAADGARGARNDAGGAAVDGTGDAPRDEAVPDADGDGGAAQEAEPVSRAPGPPGSKRSPSA